LIDEVVKGKCVGGVIDERETRQTIETKDNTNGRKDPRYSSFFLP